MSVLKESERFPRHINPYKNKRLVEQSTDQPSKIKDLTGKAGIAVSGFQQFQDRLQKQFPGVNDINKKYGGKKK